MGTDEDFSRVPGSCTAALLLRASRSLPIVMNPFRMRPPPFAS